MPHCPLGKSILRAWELDVAVLLSVAKPRASRMAATYRKDQRIQ
jgi:hypothetical protein